MCQSVASFAVITAAGGDGCANVRHRAVRTPDHGADTVGKRGDCHNFIKKRGRGSKAAAPLS